ncbi:MAG: Na+/H+ antiporter subunit E [Anaerolineales bacterium]
MGLFLLNILLAIAWVALTGSFTGVNFVLGAVLAYALLLMFRDQFQDPRYFNKVWQLIYFIVYFIWQLTLANLRVSWEVLTPGWRMEPGIVGIPLDLETELEITILANLITLTPGTLSLDVSSDGRTLYVHSMYVHDVDEFRASIKNGFEKRVRELMA